MFTLITNVKYEWSEMGEAVHFLDKQNTSPAQAVYPKLQSSSENVIYNNIFHFYSAELKETVSSELLLLSLVEMLPGKILHPQL